MTKDQQKLFEDLIDESFDTLVENATSEWVFCGDKPNMYEKTFEDTVVDSVHAMYKEFKETVTTFYTTLEFSLKNFLDGMNNYCKKKYSKSLADLMYDKIDEVYNKQRTIEDYVYSHIQENIQHVIDYEGAHEYCNSRILKILAHKVCIRLTGQIWDNYEIATNEDELMKLFDIEDMILEYYEENGIPVELDI